MTKGPKLSGSKMASDTPATPPGSVQCPVCFKYYNSDAINGHLDMCLLKSDTDSSLLTDGGGPPMKKFCTEASPHLSGSGDHPTAPSTSLGVFSMFPGNKRKVSLQNHANASFANKQPGGNKGVKRSLPAEPGAVSLGTRKKSDGQTLNVAQTLSLRTLLTSNKPLAAMLRPNTLEEYFGQSKVVGQETLMRSMLDSQEIPSLILWGPPGCGKTTLAHIIASTSKKKGTARFVKLSATSSSTAEVREVIKQAENELRLCKRKTILFVDEIHRFNKLQQDTFLPHVECGTVTLIGATTENPSFQVNSALLSRCRVLVLEKLSVEAMGSILERAVAALGIRVLEQEQARSKNTDQTDRNEPKVYIEQKALDTIAYLCDGDARAGLNSLQLAVQAQAGLTQASPLGPDSSTQEIVVKEEHVKEGLQRSHILYDNAGEEHYNCISALHKSMRGSHENAALYWLGRMLEGGEDPLFVARRLVCFASEDVGLADPLALLQAVSTFQACHFIGMPQCEVNLAQCVVYLSRAPKSMEVHMAYNNVKACLRNHNGPLPPVPLHLRNASTRLMKQLGYGKGYTYDPTVEQEYLPEKLQGIDFFSWKPSGP
ncbi:ATPase WRNIP1 isoform X1 [Dunckerocampus dactyliophorus]|uniref:ATPase WRNIP1 isoform X1 n=1 Tax=Dunckerocampus dactyliophorus TaxID=161453 RepID=UPI002404AB3D|nr:ATPase WRNIP1 isoform X1 [Dunckerocampus dactyliophorus]